MCDECNTGEATVIYSRLNIFNPSVRKNDLWGVKIFFARRKIVVVDKCMIEVIEDLNSNGFPTIFSCCGHGELKPYIFFYARDKQDEDRVTDIVSSYWGNKSYDICSRGIRLKSFQDYYPATICPK